MIRPLVLFCMALLNGYIPAIIRLPAAVVLVLCFTFSTQAEVKEIDIHQKTERNRYFLVFAARGDSADGKSITGHAFVIWGREDYKTKSSSYRAWGFYPQDLSILGQAKA